MSLSAFQKKAGLIFALAAFVLGVTAAAALGWANEKNKGNQHGKKETPTVTTPAPPQQPQQVPTTPAPTPPPAAVPPAPVAPQSAPAEVPKPAKAKRAPKKVARQRQAKAPAEVTPAAQTTLAPVVERKQLARTGLDPVLMALLGVFCLAGGGLLFRRAMVR